MIRLRTTFAVLAIVLLQPAWGDAQQLDETWTVTVNGQTIQVNPDGTFQIPNIAAPDQFGRGGPGTAPDFLSDDFLRVTGISTAGGQTLYAFSEPFQITRGETYRIKDLIITDTPPPFPVSIDVSAPNSLVPVGDTVQLTVTGKLEDGGTVDVTERKTLTIYRTSNPAVATVGENGLVSAFAVGTSFITATNEGATAVQRIVVTSDIVNTTIEGFVQLEDGTAVASAEVDAPFSETRVTDSKGFFSIPVEVPAEATLSVSATALVNGEELFGLSGALNTVPGGLTDAGVLTLGRNVLQVVGFEQGLDPRFSYPNDRVRVIGSVRSGSGYNNVRTFTESNRVAFNPFARSPSDFFWAGEGDTFDFISFVIAGAWGNQTLRIQGFNDGVQLFASDLAVTPNPQVFTANWSGIDQVRISTGSDFVDTVSGGSGQHWAMDNLTILAPPPTPVVAQAQSQQDDATTSSTDLTAAGAVEE